MQQDSTTTRDSGLLLTCDIPKGDQVASFSSFIRLTWRCPFRPSADVCVELYSSFRYKLCKVPPQLCDGRTILAFLVIVVVVIVAALRLCNDIDILRILSLYFRLLRREMLLPTSFNPLECKGSAASNEVRYTGCWWVGCHIWYS